MKAEAPDEGAALAGRLLLLLQLVSGLAVGLRVDGLGPQVEGSGSHLMVGEQELITEVVDQRVGRAATAQGATSLLLGLAEGALQLVGRRRHLRIIKAVEQMGAVAARDGNQMVDEGGGLGVEPRAGRRALQPPEKIPELGLGCGGVLRPVGPFRVRAEPTGYLAQELHVSLDAARDTDLMPVQREGLRERIEVRRGHRGTRAVFFFAASWTVLRTCSSRW